jgi:Asp-tRNA(Asn)/Glu-tRNA(Gln) amidotransferase A subunit family amidase
MPASRIAALLFLSCCALAQEPASRPRMKVEDLGAAVRGTTGLTFTEEQLKQLAGGAARHLRDYEAVRKVEVANAVFPALVFQPLLPGVERATADVPKRDLELPAAERPTDLEELAFADLRTLASLIKSRKVGCEELTRSVLARLRRLDPKLLAVVTFTEERALARARTLDAELQAGTWRGPLHGIPYGAKDLLAAKGYPTTWGAAPFREQSFDFDATVVERLEAAGAVLVAKTTLGELAMGDVWFGGTTKNPWNLGQGSSGSSAGSSAAVAAGGLPFAIGSETLGSLVSPATRCGCTSLRPTFGRVSRHGAMALSWSMDKLGPVCRSAADAALVFQAIQGPDGKDPTVVAAPFTLPVDVDVKGWKVGFLPGAESRGGAYAQVLADLRALGVELVPFTPPADYPVQSLRFILSAEAAAAFDDLTRDGKDKELKQQGDGSWPNSFRTARLIPAVEYLRANRVRTLLMQDMGKAMAGLDAVVHPSFSGSLLLATNLTGHPTVVAPVFAGEGKSPESVSFTGPLLGESRLLAVAEAWQKATRHHLQHPKLPE